MRLKHVFIAAMISLLLLAIGIFIYESILKDKIKYMTSVLVFTYYVIPMAIAAVSFWAFIQIALKIKAPGLNNVFVRMLICLIAIFPLLVAWIWLSGVQYNFWNDNFLTYLKEEIKRYWIVLTYVSISIPLILNFVVQKIIAKKEVSF